MIDLSELIDDPDFSQPGVFERVHRKFNDDGVVIETPSVDGWGRYDGVTGDKTAFRKTMPAIIQPADKDDLERLPEGERHNPTLSVFTHEQISAGDYLIYKGERWRAIGKSNWSDYGYYDSLFIRYEDTETDDSDGFELP